ncbi:MAG: 50S ribosomal protein L35 [Thiohalorhabdus sp.]|uniref:50S ribosomal protein L35 n=1 Tax=Thiohalorhabdus sp. TaxID=3094134 RepID=UPI003980834E
MPKMKTNRGAAKRFKVTARGKIKRRSSHYSHIRTKKGRDRKRNLRKPDLVSKVEEGNVRRMLPYS